MKNVSAIFWCSLIAVFTLFTACSSTGSVSKKSASNDSDRRSVYPDWYTASPSLTSTASSYQAFGSAVAADSMSALKSAADQAHNTLESGISSKLESIRSDAVIELGSDSGLDAPRYILVLRKAETEVAQAAEMGNVLVKQNESGGFSAFVKVEAAKEAVIEELDRRFSGYSNAWNAMKNSEAFSDF